MGGIIEDVERLRHVESFEDDLSLIKTAWARALTDSGERFSLDNVAAEFGVDLLGNERQTTSP